MGHKSKWYLYCAKTSENVRTPLPFTHARVSLAFASPPRGVSSLRLYYKFNMWRESGWKNLTLSRLKDKDKVAQNRWSAMLFRHDFIQTSSAVIPFLQDDYSQDHVGD